MSDHETTLLDVASNERVAAELRTRLALSDLLDAESEWTPWRFGMIKRLDAGGVPSKEWPEHWHWNWVHKLLAKGRLDIGGALSPYRLMGISQGDKWQGLVLTTSVGYQARASEGGKDLVYVKYLETAPWNLPVEALGQTPQFRGVGRQLVELVIRLSVAMEFRGRIGLHSLPQAEGFYRRCGMSDLGIDSSDDGDAALRYFEMTEQQATAFLDAGRSA